jgi:putative acetyltransferase
VPDAAAAVLSVAEETPDQPEVLAFLSASDAYAASLYPAESNHLLDIGALLAPTVAFFVARHGKAAVGCGAIVLEGDPWAEVKRMWVAPATRGLGVGRAILEALETRARQRGSGMLRLETGIHNAAALGLYRRAGFVEIGPFGSYSPDPLSVFMEKPLT